MGASAKIAAAIERAASRAECDVLILCRGGGGIEDLWAFNEEVVARAIAACPIPLISGIGHETDFTIADFVADVRAPTPTGASQLACPDREDLARQIGMLGAALRRGVQRALESRMQTADMMGCRLVHPAKRIESELAHVQRLHARLDAAWLRTAESRYWRLREISQRLTAARPYTSLLAQRQRELQLRLRRAMGVRLETLMGSLQRQRAHLAHLDPGSVLDRGYSIVYDSDGGILRSSDQIEAGDSIKITFAKGWARGRVTEKGA
jgi:exodeoxyribonuclease VII large subunit